MSQRIVRARRDFGRRLREARLAAGYPTMRALADKLRIEAPRYRHWENGVAYPDVATLRDLCRVLGVGADVLLPDPAATRSRGERSCRSAA